MVSIVCRPAPILIALVSMSVVCSSADVQTVKVDDWATIVAPTTFQLNQRFNVDVQLHGVKAPTKVKLDLHFLKKTGEFGGTLTWLDNARDVPTDGTYSFPVTIRSLKPDFGRLVLTVYLSPDGGWAKHTTIGHANMDLAGGDTGPSPTFKKSWLSVDYEPKGKLLRVGDSWRVIANYYLDPEDDWGGTTLELMGVGPWIDLPDGKYTTKRHHIGYPGLRQRRQVKPGRGQVVFDLKIPPAKKFNALLNVLWFTGADGKKWPWEKRCGGPRFRGVSEYLLDTDKPGNLFTYAGPVRITATLEKVRDWGTAKTLTYTVLDTTGGVITKGDVQFTAEKEGQVIPIDLDLQRRGVMLIKTTVDGWAPQETTFARIPDIAAITGGAKTRFGFTNAIGDEEACQVARRVGLTHCRKFFGWKDVQPARDVWLTEGLTRELEVGKKHGIDTWLLIDAPPAWALKNQGKDLHYSAFAFHEDEWRNTITHMNTVWRDLIIGWEWTNEIVPGNHTDDPVGDYLDFVKIGTTVTKQIDPTKVCTLAGGLWPRSFRKSVLAAGIGEYIDVLPLHYSNAGGVLEARGDLDVVGAQDVQIWDNETSRGVSNWDMPREEAIQHMLQSNWMMTRWPDEIVAGATSITFFGGSGEAAGNWSYMMSDMSPRPGCATVAVLVGKLFRARPVGVFGYGKSGWFHLFEKADGTSLLVASSYEETGETIALPTGANRLVMTDNQGNETTADRAGDTVRLPLNRMRVFVEGADLDVLKAQVVASVSAEGSAAGAEGARGGGSGDTVLASAPKVSMLTTSQGKVIVRISNLYDRLLNGEYRLQTPAGWPEDRGHRFSVEPGQVLIESLPIGAGAKAKPGDYAMGVSFRFDWEKLPAVVKPFGLSIISPDSLGNMLANGGLEQAGANDDAAASWSKPKYGKRVRASGDHLGHGDWMMRFENTEGNWEHMSQGIPIKGGQTYLYTLWAHNRNMGGGSNIDQTFQDGTRKSLYTPRVFSLQEGGAEWQLFAARYNAPDNVKTVGFTPVVKGGGFAEFDNLRVTPFEGTDYAAECHRAAQPVVIDGDLGEWDKRCPIPLIGPNQLTSFSDSYAWTPANCSGVAYLRWDDKALYLGMTVRDDVAKALPGENAVNGDSVVLAVQTAARLAENDGKATAFYISAASAGIGAHTLFRPEMYSGGLQAGHLARDSSVYEIAVKRVDTVTTYEVRFPFAQFPGFAPAVGTKLGLALQLNDSDGASRLGCLQWGDGIHPNWAPTMFGLVTFVE